RRTSQRRSCARCRASPARSSARARGSRVAVDALTALAAETSLLYERAQVLRRRVAVVAEVAREHVHDRDAYIETDEVGEAQRTDRMRHAKRHHLVDVLGGPDLFVERTERLVDHRHEDAVRDEPRAVRRHDRRLPELLREIDD